MYKCTLVPAPTISHPTPTPSDLNPEGTGEWGIESRGGEMGGCRGWRGARGKKKESYEQL